MAPSRFTMPVVILGLGPQREPLQKYLEALVPLDATPLCPPTNLAPATKPRCFTTTIDSTIPNPTLVKHLGIGGGLQQRHYKIWNGRMGKSGESSDTRAILPAIE
mmetsp:Transcript_93419/g.147648  ORF Transcript_93419/g.147648 Transcript_93419/m.147648 type:complete len:105 (+) Transcript_93419:313-627(+)